MRRFIVTERNGKGIDRFFFPTLEEAAVEMGRLAEKAYNETRTPHVVSPFPSWFSKDSMVVVHVLNESTALSAIAQLTVEEEE